MRYIRKLMGIGIFIIVIILTGCTQSVEYTINFDSNGGTEVLSVNTDDSSTITIPDNPTKEGFVFGGWYWDNDAFQNPFSANSLLDTPVSSDMTVYAKWSPIIPPVYVYSITYLLDGGTNNQSNPVTFDSETVTLAIVDPAKEGYTFDSWYSDEAFNTAFNFSALPNADITLYAKWIVNSYTLQYLDNDGTILQTAEYDFGASLNDVTAPIASKEGYDFVEWNQDLPLTMPARDLMITARYVIKEYTMSFNSNGGSEVSDITVAYETTIYAPENPTKDSYVFGGWYLDEGLTDYYSFPTTMIEDITLYAKWEILEYTINYYIVGVDQINNIALSEEGIVDVFFGVENSAIITSEGRVFTWGANADGQLGIGTQTTKEANLTDITSSFGLIAEEKVVKILLGAQACIARTSNGRVFTWGYDGNGQLGNGESDNSSHFTPIEITSYFNLAVGEMIVDVSLGASHSSAITSAGRIFIWGYNGAGQLGIGEVDNITVSAPRDITSQFNLDDGEMIVDVSLGNGHSAAMTSEGRIFTWGSDIQGQLGNGTSDDSTHYSPIEITSQFNLNEEENIVDILMSYYHSSAITSEGRVFNWGYNGYGNLGDGTVGNLTSPIDITSNFNLVPEEVISSISMRGADFAAAVTSEGRVFTWGRNFYGQLGIGERDYDAHSTPIDITSEFSLLEGEKIIRTSSGTNHASVITSMGRIFTWGNDNAGQLGDASLVYKTSPVLITTISSEKIHNETYGYDSLIVEYIPTREGSTFSGWYSDAELTIPYIFSTMPAYTLGLYGMWILD